MNRRQYLAAVGAISALAGCSDGSGGGGNRSENNGVSGDVRTAAGVGVSVREIETAVALETPETTYRTRDGEIALLVEIETDVAGDESADLDLAGDLAIVAEGEQVEPTSLEESEFRYPIDGSQYEGQPGSRPGVSDSGWLLFEIPRSAANDVVLSWQPARADIVEWELPIDASELPDLRLESVDAPDDVERHTAVEVSIEVRNVGGSPGRFVRPISLSPHDKVQLVDVEVGPGAAETETVKVEQYHQLSDLVDEATVEIADRTRTINWVVPERQLGESYQLPGGLEVAVDDWQEVDRVEYESDWDGEITPDAGEQLVIVEIRARNGDDLPRTAPDENAFRFLDENGGISTTTEYPEYSDPDPLVDPDVPVYRQQTLDPDDEIAGWFVTSIGADVDPTAIRWSRDTYARDHGDVDEPPDVAAKWIL